MKRYGNLFEKIVSMDNLILADKKARKGKKHRKEINRFDEKREENLLALQKALMDKTFHTSKYRKFIVHEPKEREISSLPYYPDRIVHHAIMNIVGPIWFKHLPYNSFSCIKGRGVHGCKRRVEYIMKKYEGKKLYCLKIDIEKFYPSINHEVMKAVVRKKIKDNDLLWLLDEIIDSGEGLPIGNYISQTLANVLLAGIMHRIADMGIDSVEYSDDITVFSDNKELLHKVLDEYLRLGIEDELRLHIKGNYQIFPIATNRYSKDGRGLDYLGYVFYREHILLRKRIKKRFINKIIKGKQSGLKGCALSIFVSPYLAWSKHCNSRHLEKKLLSR